jgi:hypothetical protein
MLLALASLGACDTSPDGTASLTPSSSPSVSRDPQASVHTFGREGFSLAYGGDWVARFPQGKDWYAKDPPLGQAARWSMSIVGNSETRAAADRPLIVVWVRRDRTAVDPTAFQRHAAKSLAAENPGQVFRPTTVDGIPALMAALPDPSAAPAAEEERYVLGESGIVYELDVRAPATTWSTDAPVLRGIVQSFTLPGG